MNFKKFTAKQTKEINTENDFSEMLGKRLYAAILITNENSDHICQFVEKEMVNYKNIFRIILYRRSVGHETTLYKIMNWNLYLSLLKYAKQA